MKMRDGLVVDLFAGGGGASTGLAWALGRDPDIAINHDREALAMHKANHPRTVHLQNDITRIMPLEATGGRKVAILHASPDCTHFSKAKGGKPRSQHIRDLAWVVVRWAEDTRPELITLENVEEFLTWGPLDSAGQPIKARAGETFREWAKSLRRLGYQVSWRLLRACDYGAPTTRRRLFVVARRDKRAVAWPIPTHGDPALPEVRTKKLFAWHTAAECIDWTIESQSIFGRKKPLAMNTQRRIAEGLRRYVLNAPSPFIVTYYGPKQAGITDFRGSSINAPLATITAGGYRFGLVSPVIVNSNHTASYYTPFRGQPIQEPLRTITAAPGFALATCIAKHYGGVVGHEMEKPLGTVTAIDHHSLVSACMVKYYGNERGGVSITDPLHTITSKDRIGLVTAIFDGRRAVEARDWLRMMQVIGPEEEGEIQHDGRTYRIVDICMRMLAPRELYRAQGFPDSYVIEDMPDGQKLSKSKQVRMCGNSVPPCLVEAIVRANGPDTWLREAKPYLPLVEMARASA
jgi:DNA (cytosine-5)-methyltransferase 1